MQMPIARALLMYYCYTFSFEGRRGRGGIYITFGDIAAENRRKTRLVSKLSNSTVIRDTRIIVRV